MSQIKVFDSNGSGLGGIPVRIAVGQASSEDAIFDFKTNDDGSQNWPIPYWPERDYTLHVNTGDYAVKAYGSDSRHVFDDGDQEFTLARTPLTLARLTRIDRPSHRMVSETGELIYGKGASEFLLYKRYLGGADIRPVLEQLHEDPPTLPPTATPGLGCNLIRVMGMFESLSGFNPKAYADYYDRIVEFCVLCESYGIYVLWTCCAATGAWFTEDEAIQHVKRTVEELKQTRNALCSPVNEQGQHNNSINLQRVAAEVDFGWLLHDMGSYGMDQVCRPPLGKFAVLHVDRAYSHNVRDCCTLDNSNVVNDGLELGLDEPDRFGDNGNPSVSQSADAAGTAYTALFYVFHSLQGERGEVLTGNTLDCARAAFTAMKGR